MTVEQIKRLRDATPFRAFRIHMAKGKSADIPHPDFINLSLTERILIISRTDDSFELVDTLLVTSLETLPKNGTLARRRRR
jgi:hypothetical protein